MVSELVQRIEAFHDHAEAASDRTWAQSVLLADFELSPPPTRRLRDGGSPELLRGHVATVSGAIGAHGGRTVKHTGDGTRASFLPVAAETAALQIQREVVGGEVRVRVGSNAGEPIAEDDDPFGLTVIKAPRVADRAELGQVQVTNVARKLGEGRRFDLASRSEVQLKDSADVVGLSEVTA